VPQNAFGPELNLRPTLFGVCVAMPNSKAITLKRRLLHSMFLMLVCAWFALLCASSQFSRVGVSTGH
jgi:hypothetical protein